MILLGPIFAWCLLVAALRTDPVVSNRWNVGMVAAVLAAVAATASGVSTNTVYDRGIYGLHFAHLGLVSSPSKLPNEATDPLFDRLLWVMAHVLPTTSVALFIAVGVLMAIGSLWAFAQILPPWAVLGAFVTMIATGLFGAYSGVVIRQGLAVAVLLPALSLAITHHRPRVMLALLVAAPLLHWTALVPAVAVLVIRYGRIPLRPLVVGWLVLAVAFVLGVQEHFLGGLTSLVPEIDTYSSPTAISTYAGGVNRLDFLALSGGTLAAALIARRWIGRDEVYDALIAAFVLFNAVFLVFGFIAYSDRLVAYSRFVAPMLAWYALARWAPGRPALLPVVGMLGALALGFSTGTWADLAGVV